MTSTLESLVLVAVFASPIAAMAQGPDVQTTDELVALDVQTTCGSGFTDDLTAALEVDLAAWRRREALAALHCAPVLVRFVFERCDHPGTVRIEVVAGRAPLLAEALPSGDATTRALALAAAELVERAYRRCTEHVESPLDIPPPLDTPPPTDLGVPWHDHRPQATEADHDRYFREMELSRRFMRRVQTIETGVLAQMRAGAFFDAQRTGVGGFADISLSAWVAGGLLLRAELGPATLAVGGGPGIGQIGGSMLVGYDFGFFALALGGGVGTGNAQPGAPPLGRIDGYMRIGLEPGAFAAVLLALAVDDGGMDFGLISARFSVPVSQTIGLYWRVEFAWAFASGRIDLGVRYWLDGDIVSASGIALEVGVSGVGFLFKPRCEFGLCDERTLAVGPGLHLGLTLRGGD